MSTKLTTQIHLGRVSPELAARFRAYCERENLSQRAALERLLNIVEGEKTNENA